MTKQPKTRDQRHHRRGPFKRFLLATGPFCFLTAAFVMSAGVVEIVEWTPASQPATTLAEERAEAEANQPAYEALPGSITATRIPALPASLLDPGDYAGAHGPVTVVSSEQNAGDRFSEFGLLNPAGPKLALGSARGSLGYGALLADPQDLGLR